MRPRLFSILCFLSLFSGLAYSLAGPQTNTEATVLIVGTFHMANRGHDAYNVQADDVISTKGQQEIEKVIEVLKILVGSAACSQGPVSGVRNLAT